MKETIKYLHEYLAMKWFHFKIKHCLHSYEVFFVQEYVDCEYDRVEVYQCRWCGKIKSKIYISSKRKSKEDVY